MNALGALWAAIVQAEAARLGLDELAREGVPQKCPRCSANRRGVGLHWHSESVWCVACGWSRRRTR